MSSTTRIVSKKKFNVELVDKYLNQINEKNFRGLLDIVRFQNESWSVYLEKKNVIDISFGEHSIGFNNGMSDETVYIEVVLRNNLAILLNSILEFDHDSSKQKPSEDYANCMSFYEFRQLYYGKDRDMKEMIMRKMIDDFEYFPARIRPLFGLTEEEIQTAKVLQF